MSFLHLSSGVLQQFLSTYGYLAVYGFVGIESTGIPFPGETMLIVAGAYAGAGHLQIPLVIAAAALGAISGDNLGYWIGRTGGRTLALRLGRYVRLDERKLARAQEYYAKYGDKTVFLGRYIAILRAWNAFLAGVNRMPWPKFFAFDAAAAITWSTLYGLLAFELGKNLPLLSKVIRVMGIGGIALVVVAAVVVLFFHLRRRRSVERDLETAMKREAPTRDVG